MGMDRARVAAGQSACGSPSFCFLSLLKRAPFALTKKKMVRHYLPNLHGGCAPGVWGEGDQVFQGPKVTPSSNGTVTGFGPLFSKGVQFNKIEIFSQKRLALQ